MKTITQHYPKDDQQCGFFHKQTAANLYGRFNKEKLVFISSSGAIIPWNDVLSWWD